MKMIGPWLLETRIEAGTRGLLTFPSSLVGADAAPKMRRVLRRLVAALPSDRELVVACHASALEEVRTWPGLQRSGIRWLAIEDEIDFTIWIQDSFLSCRTEGGGGTILFPIRGNRRRDADLAEHIAETLGIPVRQATARFEGGNVLVAGNHVFLGADTPELREIEGLDDPRIVLRIGGGNPHPPSSLTLHETPDGLVLEERNGQTGRRQPLYHLDLFMTPAGPQADGREVVLVGDSRLASRIAGSTKLPLEDQSVADALDAVAEQLRALDGLVVIRNPLPILPLIESGMAKWTRRSIAQHYAGWADLDRVLAALDQRGQKRCEVRRWRAASQNGCLVFGGPGDGLVLLPSYADEPYGFLAEVEAENERIWRSLGYAIAPLPGAMVLAAENGSPHCLFKALV